MRRYKTDPHPPHPPFPTAPRRWQFDDWAAI